MTSPPRFHGWSTAGNGAHKAPGTGPRQVIALERALLCLDCEAIFEMSGAPALCPACGSRTAWTLARLLARPAA